METALVTGNATLDHYLAILGIVTTLSSAAATFLNAKVRSAIDAQEEVPGVFLYAALIANYAAINIDKCAQLHRLLRGKPATVMIVRGEPSHAAPSQPPAADAAAPSQPPAEGP